MATKNTKRAEPAKHDGSSNAKYYAIIAAAVLIAVGAVGWFALSLQTSGANASFSTFRSNFQAAPRVAIFSTAYTGTGISSTVGCATSIIENVVGSQTSHRNATTIDFYIVNATSCTFLKSGLGSRSNNYTTVPLANCTANISKEPTIYLNYTSGTSTTLIKPDYIYIAGNQTFLAECGIAEELG